MPFRCTLRVALLSGSCVEWWQRENREVNAAHAELTAEADELRQQVEQLNATVRIHQTPFDT